MAISHGLVATMARTSFTFPDRWDIAFASVQAPRLLGRRARGLVSRGDGVVWSRCKHGRMDRPHAACPDCEAELDGFRCRPACEERAERELTAAYREQLTERQLVDDSTPAKRTTDPDSEPAAWSPLRSCPSESAAAQGDRRVAGGTTSGSG